MRDTVTTHVYLLMIDRGDYGDYDRPLGIYTTLFRAKFAAWCHLRNTDPTAALSAWKGWEDWKGARRFIQAHSRPADSYIAGAYYTIFEFDQNGVPRTDFEEEEEAR